MTEERPGSGQHHQQQQQKRRAWLRRASTSSDHQPPPQRSSGRRLSAYDQLIAERTRRGITISLERRSSVVSSGSSEPEFVDSGSGSGSRSGSVSGSGTVPGSGSRPQDPAEVSLRPLPPRSDPLDETQLSTGAVHREGAAHCHKADGVPLLDHLIQLAAERGAKQAPQQGTHSRPAELPEEKRVRFREGWRSARGTGSLSSLHEDEVKSVAERMAPYGILKNGTSVTRKEELQDNGDTSESEEASENMCKGANRHEEKRIARENESSETEKAADISSIGGAPLASASAEEGNENDGEFEHKAVTPDANDSITTQPDIKQADETPQSTQITNSENENAPRTVEISDDTDSLSAFNAGSTDKSAEEVESTSADDIRCELIAGDESPTKAPASMKEESKCEKAAEGYHNSNESSPAMSSSAPPSDAQAAAVSQAERDVPATDPPADTSASTNKATRTRLYSVPEEPPSSPNHLHTDPSDSPAHNTVNSPVSENGGGDPPTGARQKTLPPSQLRSARGAPSRRWSVSGELTSHRRDRAAISRRLVYLTLSSDESGEPAPVFEEPTGSAVEFDPRRGEWRPLTVEERQRLTQHRRMSLTKTCSLDFDRIP